MTDLNVWVIKHGQFEARIDVNQIGQLPVYNVRKLLKLSRTADNLDSLESFGPLLKKASDQALNRLCEVIRSPLIEVMGWDEVPKWCDTEKAQDALRRVLIKDQKRALARLDKIKYIYEKEFMNYVY